MSARREILSDNVRRRAGLDPVRRLPDGEVTFKIPERDMKVLATLFPGLVSHDNAERLSAWKQLRHSPIGEQYLVTRTPRQVQRSQQGIIVK